MFVYVLLLNETELHASLGVGLSYFRHCMCVWSGSGRFPPLHVGWQWWTLIFSPKRACLA